MGKLDDLVPPKRVYACGVRTLRSTLDENDVKALDEAIANQAWSALGLSKALAARNIELHQSTITKHRQGVCSCSKI